MYQLYEDYNCNFKVEVITFETSETLRICIQTIKRNHNVLNIDAINFAKLALAKIYFANRIGQCYPSLKAGTHCFI